MPARNLFHEAVTHALQRDGWTITHDPLLLHMGAVEMSIDLGAEKLIAAERNGLKIAVEIKSFVGPSAISEFHTALGQFLNYRQALEEQDPERTLYLAIPLDTYDSFFILPFIQQVVQRHQLHLIVYETEKETIVQWLK
jgi:hypothetical protein